MPERCYQNLPERERRDALEVAESNGGRKAHLLEKDIWVVATLDILFDSPFAKHLIFKGGTSLSKVWNAIRRFSEDVDITYDIRAFAPDLVAGTGEEALPSTRSQQKRWTRDIRSRLDEWVWNYAHPLIANGLAESGFDSEVRAENEKLFVNFDPLFAETGFVRPEVLIEFGARSTGEPHVSQRVVCDTAMHLPSLKFPEAQPNTMLASRTFWEKATAAHVYCRQERRRGERLSRHWHDLARLDEAGIAASALADRELARAVARHKKIFFSENDASGERIDYEAAVSGRLQLVPSGDAYSVLADDHAKMLADGMLLDQTESFDVLMERCAKLAAQANSLLSIEPKICSMN